MKDLLFLRCGAVMVLLSVLLACESSSAQGETAGAPAAAPSEPAASRYDPAQGAHALMPKKVKLLGDTFGIVMYESVMEPGDSAIWHEHPYHTVYVLEGGSLTVYFEDGEPQPFELPQGAALIQPPLGDAAVNTGETTVRLLTHDLYSLNP